MTRLDFDGIDDGSYQTNSQGNNLTGNLPPDFGDLSELELVIIDYNNIQGAIPSSIGQLQKLKNLSALNCNFSGSLPDEIYDLTDLTLLCFRNNNLTGPISPLIANMQDLYLLCLDGNDMTGELPPEMGSLSKLGVLWLDRNDFVGVVPSTFKNLTSLDRFSMGPGLEGNVEDFIPENENMAIVSIIATRITGDIGFFCNFPNLRSLGVSYSRLHGSISPCFLESTTLTRLIVNNNLLEGCYPETDITLCEKEFQNINLSGNVGLPWEGDLDEYCNGSQQQQGSPCTMSDGNVGQIGSDCLCGEPRACDLSYEISKDFVFRGRRCLLQPVYPGQISDSEGVVITKVIPKRKYVFEFCESYDMSIFEAKVTILDYDASSGQQGEIIYEGTGCLHEFKVPEDVIYSDALVIITDNSECAYASKNLQNGIPKFKCAVGR